MIRAPASVRLGVADSRDPTDMQAGSGATGSLLRGLEGLVAEVVPISAELPPALGRAAHLASIAARLRPRDVRDVRGAARAAHAGAQLGRPTMLARRAITHRRLTAAGQLDGVIQRGSELRLPAGQRIASFEDSTVVQARRSYPWEHLSGLSEQDFAQYVARQRHLYSVAVACCCSTRWAADSVVADYGVPAEKVFVVGFGPNHEPAAPQPRDWSTPRFLFVGVDWTRKNGPAVLRAFAGVRERIPTAELHVVGEHPRIDQDGVHAYGRMSLADDADRERMTQLFRRATAFVMPSLHEPAGIVYIEAAGSGLASLGSTDGGAATMIGPGGIVVDPRDPAEILAAMLQLADPDTARRLGELAYGYSSLLTWRKVAERVLRALAIPGVDVSGLAECL